jgi:hypothetical protein
MDKCAHGLKEQVMGWLTGWTLVGLKVDGGGNVKLNNDMSVNFIYYLGFFFIIYVG